jgi:hypothetical protein
VNFGNIYWRNIYCFRFQAHDIYTQSVSRMLIGEVEDATFQHHLSDTCHIEDNTLQTR